MIRLNDIVLIKYDILNYCLKPGRSIFCQNLEIALALILLGIIWIKFIFSGPIHTLVLGELTPDLLGTYTCTIMNKNGSKSTRCQVSVEGGQVDNTKSYTKVFRFIVYFGFRASLFAA